MTPASRSAFKLAAFAAPALLATAGLHVAGDPVAAWIERGLRPGNYTIELAGNSYSVPDDAWANAFAGFLSRYVDGAKRHDLEAGAAQVGLPTGLRGLRVVAYEPGPREPGELYDPATRTVRLPRGDSPATALHLYSRALALALLHDAAPGAAWSPGFASGFAGCFETDSLQFGGRDLERVIAARGGKLAPVEIATATAARLQDPAEASRAYVLWRLLRHDPAGPARLAAWIAEERRPGPPDPRVLEEILAPAAAAFRAELAK